MMFADYLIEVSFARQLGHFAVVFYIQSLCVYIHVQISRVVKRTIYKHHSTQYCFTTADKPDMFITKKK